MSEEAVVAAPEAEVKAPQGAPATETAPESTATAAADDSPVAGEGEQPEKQDAKPKTFTQEDVDRIVSKEKARVERKLQRDLQREIDQRIEDRMKNLQPSKPEAETAPQRPKPEDFATTEEYVEAVATMKAQEYYRSQMETTEKQRREMAARQHHEQVATSFKQRETAAMEKYEDFEEVAYNPLIPITRPMAEAIQESELGPELAYHLGKNPQEADRIARLSPLSQAKELGKLEAKLSTTVTPPKLSSAPAPISPIRTPSGTPSFVDTTDPKSAEKMSTTEWINAERERQRKKWEVQHRR